MTEHCRLVDDKKLVTRLILIRAHVSGFGAMKKIRVVILIWLSEPLCFWFTRVKTRRKKGQCWYSIVERWWEEWEKPPLFNLNIIESKLKQAVASSGWRLISNAGTCTVALYEWEEKYQSTAKISNALKTFLPHTWSQLEGVSAKKQRWIFLTQETLEIMNNAIHADSLPSTL